LAQGAQQIDPTGIRKRQSLQIQAYLVDGSRCRNDVPRLVDPRTK
jgi:hypothetical protein